MKNTALIVVAAGCAIAHAPVATAGVAPEDQAFQKQIFGHVLGAKPAHACFKRVYAAAHLARHPEQNVRTMTLLVTGKVEDPDQPSYTLGLGVTFRRSGTHFETAGDCGTIRDAASRGAKANAVTCGVDCDGGSIDVTLKDGATVLVAIPDGARIWKAGSDDDETGSERKRFGADDRLFRLDRAPLGDCLPLAPDDDQKAAMERGQ
ncbi:hypothetical protein [Labrys monachus]|uniref:Uncharacterized protein n=1 Tax=Labrys monachus TaxID=217067 RepID=A0ABU0FHV9_9HYPH|nr:hypothetical protein [Labrys monachus]MDQ0394198.1 hypothetical protein [Labrys monachus]